MRAVVTGGAGFIGSHIVDALVKRGDEVVVVDDLSTGRESNIGTAIERGATLVQGDIRDAELVARLLRREAARCRVPPCRTDRRARIGAQPVQGRGGERRRHHQPARGRAPLRRATVRVRLHGWGNLRRERPTARRARSDPSAVAVRAGQVRGRRLLRPLQTPASGVDDQPAFSERLRAATGSARRGRGDRDLLREAAIRRTAHRLRRWAPDPRFRLRRRRRQGGADRIRKRRARRLQHRPGRGGHCAGGGGAPASVRAGARGAGRLELRAPVRAGTEGGGPTERARSR